MAEEERLEELKPYELIYSLAYMRAQEAGLLGDIELSPSEIGTLGAMSSDIHETLLKKEKKEITSEEARQEVNSAIKTTIGVFISNLYDKVTEPIAQKIKERIPVISVVVDSVRTFVKEKVIKKGVEVVEQAYNWVKNKIKALFS